MDDFSTLKRKSHRVLNGGNELGVARTTIVNELKSAIAENSSADLRWHLAQHQLLSGDLPSALANFRKAVQEDKENLNLRISYAHCLSSCGDKDKEAWNEYQAILEKDPQNFEAKHGACLILIRHHRFHEALEFALACNDLGQDQERSLHAMAMAHKGLGDLVKAELFYRELLLECPRVAEYWNSLGNLLRELNSTASRREAISAYSKAFDLDPDGKFLVSRGIAKKEIGDKQGADRDFLSALDLPISEFRSQICLANLNRTASNNEDGDLIK